MASTEIENPDLPFLDVIPGGLSVGKEIQIQGLFPQVFDVFQCSQINLCEKMSDTIALHISVSFKSRQVIRNTFQKNRWEEGDEDGPFPFGQGRQFLIHIFVQPNGYEISVNGRNCWTYNHRLPYSAVTHLNIDGPLIIWNVSFKGSAQVQTGNLQFPPRPPETTRLISNPSLPYWGDLPQRLAVGSVVEIMGLFPTSIDRFQDTLISLCQSSISTIAFHLIISFYDEVVVLNTYRKDQWETEERKDPFPFALGKKFLIRIIVQLLHYQIFINGTTSWSFSHRLPFGMVDGLNISGPVNIVHVDYTSTMDQQQMSLQQNSTCTQDPSVPMHQQQQQQQRQPQKSTYAQDPPVSMHQQQQQQRQQRQTRVHSPPVPRHRQQQQQRQTYTQVPPVSMHQQQQQRQQRQTHARAPLLPTPSEAPPSLHNVYNPVVPFSYHIHGGIKANMMIYISGVPLPDFHNFTISLECDQQDVRADIAIKLDVRYYNRTVARNTRFRNRWKDEETTALSFPFKPTFPFLITILVQKDKYVISVDGTQFTEHYHWINNFSRINVLKIENDVRIASVRFSELLNHIALNYNTPKNEW